MENKNILPDDMDKECIEICEAMNLFEGINTISSCCGHGKDWHGYWIFFKADSLEVLPPLLYWFDSCHNGLNGWKVVARTDCAMSPVTFLLEGPVGQEGYEGSLKIAELLRKHIKDELES